MRFRYVIPCSIALVVALVSLISCNTNNANTVTGSNSKKTVAVTDRDNNGTVSLNKGDLLEVKLVGNPTTGYGWQQAAADAAVVRQAGEPEYTSDSTAIGSPGVFTIRYDAVGAGQTTLKMTYQRPFEPDAPPAQTFQISIQVS